MFMQNYVAQFLIVLILFVSVSPVAAQTGDWNALTSQINKEVAVKAENRKTVFGILTETTSDSIKIKTPVGKSASEVSFKREEVDKIWLATLSNGSRKTLRDVGISAAVGAGVGVGVGLIALGATGGSDDSAGILGASTAIGGGLARQSAEQADSFRARKIKRIV